MLTASKIFRQYLTTLYLEKYLQNKSIGEKLYKENYGEQFIYELNRDEISNNSITDEPPRE